MTCHGKKILLFDLDDTVLGGGFEVYARFPDHFSVFLDSISNAGWEWGINSAWDCKGQWWLAVHSGINKSRPSVLICRYGREIYTVRDESPEKLEPYCSNMESRLLEYAANDLQPILNSLKEETELEQIKCFYKEENVVIDFSDKVDILHSNSPTLKKIRNSELFTLLESEHSLKIRPHFCNKGTPIQALNTLLGYHPENIVCAGDAAPDLFMLNTPFAKHAIAPANAQDCIKNFLNLHNGTLGSKKYAAGVIDAFEKRFPNYSSKI